MSPDPGAPVVALCWLKGRLFEPVEQEVARQWPAYAPWPDPPGDASSYARHLLQLLSGGRDVVICEGDVVPPPGAILQLLGCASEWCTHECWLGERYVADTLGLVKFSGSLVLDYPGWPSRALLLPPERGGLVHVRSVDAALARYLYGRGLRPHVHRPPAVHLRYPNDPLLPSRLPDYRPREPEGLEDVRRPR